MAELIKHSKDDLQAGKPKEVGIGHKIKKALFRTPLIYQENGFAQALLNYFNEKNSAEFCNGMLDKVSLEIRYSGQYRGDSKNWRSQDVPPYKYFVNYNYSGILLPRGQLTGGFKSEREYGADGGKFTDSLLDFFNQATQEEREKLAVIDDYLKQTPAEPGIHDKGYLIISLATAKDKETKQGFTPLKDSELTKLDNIQFDARFYDGNER